MTRTGWLLVGLAGTIGLLGYTKKTQIVKGVSDMLTPRGIRDNNPGNIRLSSTVWQGQSAQQTDVVFVQFDTPEYGIRALSHILDSYSNKHGLHTVASIINRYAPPVENQTGAYVQAVANAAGVAPDAVISVANYKPALIAGIIQHENGQQPYTAQQIQAGIYLA
jgi:hypothetical protein